MVYDYPVQPPARGVVRRVRRDWAAFRRQSGDRRPGRSWPTRWGPCWRGRYVEDDAQPAGDVSTLILIAPVNQGSSLAQVQTVLQWLKGLQADRRARRRPRRWLYLGDGLGEAAHDILPGSAFLTTLNGRPRRAGGALSHPGRRRRFPDRWRPAPDRGPAPDAAERNAGLLGGLTPGGHRRPARRSSTSSPTGRAMAASRSSAPGSTAWPTT